MRYRASPRTHLSSANDGRTTARRRTKERGDASLSLFTARTYSLDDRIDGSGTRAAFSRRYRALSIDTSRDTSRHMTRIRRTKLPRCATVTITRRGIFSFFCLSVALRHAISHPGSYVGFSSTSEYDTPRRNRTCTFTYSRGISRLTEVRVSLLSWSPRVWHPATTLRNAVPGTEDT